LENKDFTFAWRSAATKMRVRKQGFFKRAYPILPVRSVLLADNVRTEDLILHPTTVQKAIEDSEKTLGLASRYWSLGSESSA
jgi:hypothetical protein